MGPDPGRAGVGSHSFCEVTWDKRKQWQLGRHSWARLLWALFSFARTSLPVPTIDAATQGLGRFRAQSKDAWIKSAILVRSPARYRAFDGAVVNGP